MNATSSACNVLRHPLLQRGVRLHARLETLLGWFAPLVDLAVRLWVAQAFFASGLTKIASFDSTVLLFTYEYQVPLLPPMLAAVLGTAAELALPVLLVFGFGGRLPAAALFVFNIIAVISYPALEAAGLHEHQLWGLLLLVTLTHGPGALTLDRLLARWSR